MKKQSILLCFVVASFLLFTISEKIYAFTYTISFTGTGASTSVQSVVVQNLTKGTAVTVPAGNVLNLTELNTSVDYINGLDENISVYPNPIHEKSTISFYAKSDGKVHIKIFSIDGKKLIESSRNIHNGINSFQLSIPKGIYTIQVQGKGFSYNAKVISQINSDCKAQMVFSENENQSVSNPQKTKNSATTMLYSTGDQLLYKGISGNYSTLITDIPTGSKTTNFLFIECKDADNNHYPIVKIGNQVWMAENLKYLPSVVGPTIGSPSTPYYYVSGYNGTSVVAAKSTTNYITYGVLYNWTAAMDGSASSTANPSRVKGVCPTGWHLPSDAEWTQLTDYLGGRTVAGGKLKETGTTLWNSPNTGATNETGFSARPGGARYPYTAPGEFYALKRMAYFRTSTEGSGNDTIYSYRRGLSDVTEGVSRTLNDALKESAFCVRCVKD
jgi:uncharacterized protein (TIGR02145 family)